MEAVGVWEVWGGGDPRGEGAGPLDGHETLGAGDDLPARVPHLVQLEEVALLQPLALQVVEPARLHEGNTDTSMA